VFGYFDFPAELVMKIIRIVLIVSLFASTTGRAQTLVVHAGHLINPANGSIAANQSVVIDDGKITAIATNPKVPAGAEVIDLAKEWVMPGLVDAHTHITMNLPPAAPGESYWENYLLSESTALASILQVVLRTAISSLESEKPRADHYIGKRACFSAFVKTTDAQGPDSGCALTRGSHSTICETV
jgi:hypothetical protein